MKNNYFLILTLFLLFSTASQAQNLIPNPGFEEGSGATFTGWNKFNEISGTFSEGTADGDFRSGERSLVGTVNMPGEAWHLQLASDLIATQVGEDYTYSVWVKAATAGTEIRFSTQPNALYSANYTVSTEWTELEWTFTANEEMTRIVLDLGAEVNTYYLDDMTLDGLPGGTGGCQPIENGGFESYIEAVDSFAGWTFINELGGSSFALATGDNAYAGDNAIQANNLGGIERWGLQLATPAFPTVSAQTYTLNLWIKADNANTNSIQFSVRDRNAENEGQYTNSATTIGGDWMLLEYRFTAIDDSTVITLNLGDATANTYYLDEVCLIQPETLDDCAAVDNSGFETYDEGSGTFAGWTYYNQNNGSSFGVTMDGDDVYEGANALVATNAAGSQTFDLQIASPSFYTLAGGTYRLNVWVKAATPETNTIQFSVREAGDPFNTESQYTTSATTIGGDFMQVTYEFVASSARTFVTLNLGGDAENTFYLDEICVETVCGTDFTAPEDQEPIAAGKEKFLGNIYAGHALPDFEKYFNQVTPENSGKWGSVEGERDVFNWTQLDEARQFARDNDFPFRLHVMLWGSQQPAWLEDLTPAEQLEEIREWFEAVTTRYSGEDAPEYVEVVNEPLNAPPIYREALTSLNEELGTEAWEYDWITNAFKLARQYFPQESQLMINEYGLANTAALTDTYVSIVARLQEDGLIDAVGMQGHTFSTKLYGGTYEDLNNLLSRNLEALAGTGLPVMVTEMDIEGNMFFDNNGLPQDGGTQEQKDSFQLAEFQRIFDLYWNHPSVIGITLWGWRPGLWQNDAEAYLIDPCTGQPRPALDYLNSVIRASNPMVDIPTDVLDLDNNLSTFRIYPTVTTNELTLEGIPANSGPIRIFTLNGQLVQSVDRALVQGDLMRIHLTDLPSGLYIVQCGRSVQKFIKQ
ncbi:endo-1,4-beta-xylanase [Neolewinella lacunae]|uniref:endo-1,4-beta-xylanase n=1 Tax=Neolewinella lacunae TaxID=1517758 RepID=A0A923T9C0_9BACT|nr:endo-1,4-beta-xylanase [Neolewinella lacunae]MBC6994903.1 endo-1,4-beta-xylanase [Neolewinella lacunae]MDN3635410.1 endo-1,4-beta-xylanase [Neolewinella lacunae]